MMPPWEILFLVIMALGLGIVGVLILNVAWALMNQPVKTGEIS